MSHPTGAHHELSGLPAAKIPAVLTLRIHSYGNTQISPKSSIKLAVMSAEFWKRSRMNPVCVMYPSTHPYPCSHPSAALVQVLEVPQLRPTLRAEVQ